MHLHTIGRLVRQYNSHFLSKIHPEATDEFELADFPSGGLTRFPAARQTESVGHTSMQLAQAKKSGMTFSHFKMAFITVEGYAFAHTSQVMPVSKLILNLKMLIFSTGLPVKSLLHSRKFSDGF
jgi:hypothetical protein